MTAIEEAKKLKATETAYGSALMVFLDKYPDDRKTFEYIWWFDEVVEPDRYNLQ
jgi:hypothetical protein